MQQVKEPLYGFKWTLFNLKLRTRGIQADWKSTFVSQPATPFHNSNRIMSIELIKRTNRIKNVFGSHVEVN